MFLIFRAWLFIRLLEEQYPTDLSQKGKERKLSISLTKLSKRKSLFGLGRPYGIKPVIKAAMYSQAEGYLESNKGEQHYELTPEGFLFATPSGLIDKILKTFTWSLQLGTIAISLGALIVAVIALK